MLSTTAYPGIEYYAREDFENLCEQANNKWGFDADLISMNIDYDVIEEGIKSVYTITGVFQIEGLEFSLTYHCYDDINEDELEFEELFPQDLHDAYMHRYYMSMNQKWDAKEFGDKLKARNVEFNDYPSHKVESATAILAADEDDPFDDMGFEDEDAEAPLEDEDSLADNIDEMTDALDDINDSLKDFKEDEVDIETENNIADHLIAECEKCHGVFITAVLESDQELEKISGICPLCDEECDQYIKWVIKEL